LRFSAEALVTCAVARVRDGLGEDLRQRHAQRVVHAALPARQHVDELRLLGQGGAAQCQQAGHQAGREGGFQTHLVLLLFCVWQQRKPW
jgi:hypothetical protein